MQTMFLSKCFCSKFENSISVGYVETKLNTTAGPKIFMITDPWNIGHGQICITAFRLYAAEIMYNVAGLKPLYLFNTLKTLKVS